MTEESKLDLPTSAINFLDTLKARHPDLPETDLLQMSSDLPGYIKGRYLKPNWPHWRNMGEVSLQRAVWLSFDIEPWLETSDVNEAIEGISKRPAPVMRKWYDVQLRDSLRQDYEPRMAQCWAAISAGRLRYRGVNDVMGRLVRCFVSLPDFRRWGESLPVPYTFPDEFPGAAAAEPKIPTVKVGELASLTSGRIAGFMTLNEYVKAIMDQARLAFLADPAIGSQGADSITGTNDGTVAKAAQKPADWKTEARTLADQVAIDRWNNGIQQNSAREIAPKVADLLARNPDYHGERGPRDANTVRSQALKGWKFTPPAGSTGSSGSSGSSRTA